MYSRSISMQTTQYIAPMRSLFIGSYKSADHIGDADPMDMYLDCKNERAGNRSEMVI